MTDEQCIQTPIFSAERTIGMVLHYGITPIETHRSKKVGYPRRFACP